MSESPNVKIVRDAYEAAQRERTLESFLELLDPEIVWDNRAVWPDGSCYRGLDEVRREARRWLGTWEEYSFTPQEFIDAGDCVLVPLRVHGRGKGSGVEVDHSFVESWRLRDGKAVEHYAYRTKEEAFEALGLGSSGGKDDAQPSADVIDAVNRVVTAFNRGDVEAMMQEFSPDVRTYDAFELPGGGEHHGVEEVRRVYEDFLASFADLRVEAKEIIEIGEQVVLVYRASGRGRDSDMPVEVTAANVYKLRDGKVVEMRSFMNREDALAAARS